MQQFMQVGDVRGEKTWHAIVHASGRRKRRKDVAQLSRVERTWFGDGGCHKRASRRGWANIRLVKLGFGYCVGLWVQA